MPIYEYTCPHCQKTFEEWLRSTDDSATHPCPTCGQPSPRVISQTTFILKGSGWYVTEYGSHHGGANEEEAEGSAKPNTEKSGLDDACVNPKDATSASADESGKTSGTHPDKSETNKAGPSGTDADKGNKTAPANDKNAPTAKAQPAPRTSTATPAPSGKTSGGTSSSASNTASAAGA